MKKSFLLDTSVLIHNPRCFESLEPKSDIYINITILQELDNLKSKEFIESAKSARQAIRYLDEILVGDINAGIKLNNGSTLRVHQPKLETVDNVGYGDNCILQSLRELSAGKKNKPVLLTRDINLRVRARAEGLLAEGYEKNVKKDSEYYTGCHTVQSEELAKQLEDVDHLTIAMYDELQEILPNESVYFTDKTGEVLALGRRCGNKINRIKPRKHWGIEAKSLEQALAMDLLESKCELISITGGPGSGKTLLSLAYGLEAVINQKKFKKFIIYRPLQIAGQHDIGYLPGEKDSKLDPFFGAILDNFEVLLSNSAKSGQDWKYTLEMWKKKGLLDYDVLTFARGRSLPDCLILLDEGQQYSSSDIKTLLTRVGKGSKVILTADQNQIDRKDIDTDTNAASIISNLFRGESLFGGIRLIKTERSKLAELADKLL